MLLTSGVAVADDAGIPLGPGNIFPSLGVTLKRTSNLFLEEANPASDWITTVSPALKFALPVHPYFLELKGQLDWITYAQNDSEDAVNWSLGGQVGANFAQGLTFALESIYHNRYLVHTQEFGAGEESSIWNTAAKVTYTIQDKARVDLRWFRNSYTFDRSATREHVENVCQAGLFWRYRPRLSALLEGGLTGYAYDSNTAQDGTARWFNLGLTWDIGVHSSGHVKGGYRWKSYDVVNQERNTVDGSYYTAAIGLTHRVTNRMTLEAEASRMSMESDFLRNPYYLRNEISAGLEQRFRGSLSSLSAKISAKYTLDEYREDTSYAGDSGKRTDTTLGGSVGIGYDFMRWVRLGVSLTTQSRNSSFDAFDYKETVLGFDISAKF